MKEIAWDNILSVGEDEIDEDHRRLIDLLNILNHSVMDGEAPIYLAAVLEELINCTVWHFSHEERLMLKYGYQGYSDHKAEHQELINSVKALQQKMLQAGKSVVSDDIEFLEHWLTEHILSTDMKLGSFLAEKM